MPSREAEMLGTFHSRLVWVVGVFALAGGIAVAQQAPPASVAPVPSAILSGKKVFLSNAGADAGLFPHPFSGGTDRGYNQLYSALQAWGRYELVGDPQEAELVFELQLTAPGGPANASKMKGASDPWPMFRLVILDRKTHYILWTFTESIEPANFQKTHDRNFDDALSALTTDLKKLTSQTSAAR
jgi:hypothetical protein